MNERIRELILKAGFPKFDEMYVVSDGAELEQFAELIVGECVRVVEGGSFLHDQAPTAIFARECSSAIKRHFGVE